MGGLLAEGEPQALTKRGLSLETCERWGYTVSRHHGKPVQIANYRKGGRVVAQKVRDADKNFRTFGAWNEAGLFGRHLWTQGGKKVVVTEGEIDAMSVSQIQDHKYPVVSLPSGAGSARSAMQEDIEWLNTFGEIVLMFDQDDAGRAAVAAVAPLFPREKLVVAELPLKDANAMLVAGRAKEVTNGIWNAQPYRPDGIVGVRDIRDQLDTPVAAGIDWPWGGVTDATVGRLPGELYGIGAGTGVGKTHFCIQTIAHTALVQDERCGIVFMEQPPAETIRRIAGALDGRLYHLPGADDDDESAAQMSATFDRIEGSNNVFMLDHFGSAEWSHIRDRIRYLAAGLECRHIFVDHITALVANETDERRAIDAIMADLSSLAQELSVCIYVVSHLSTPDGTPHEEGGRVSSRHLKGSRAVSQWCHTIFGLERDQQADDPADRALTTVRVLKCRRAGHNTGRTITLRYDNDTGLLSEEEGCEDAVFAGVADQPDF